MSLKEKHKALAVKADAGDPNAQRSLGLLLELGLYEGGTMPPNWAEAQHYYELAAQKKDGFAAVSLANAASIGKTGLEPNAQAYEHWAAQAKVLGFMPAKERLKKLKEERVQQVAIKKARSKAMVYEHSVTDRNAIIEVLDKLNFDCESPKSTQDLFTFLSNDWGIDTAFIATDIPGTRPLEIIEKTRKLFPNIKLIAVSSNVEPELVQKGKELGLKAWLVRPVKPEALMAKAEKILKPVPRSA